MRIQQIKAENNILLHRIQKFETRMNRAKQQGETVCKLDETLLNAMVSKSLYLLAQVQILQTVDTKLVHQHLLETMYQRHHQILFKQFIQRLFYERQLRKEKLQRLHHIDFKIWQ